MRNRLLLLFAVFGAPQLALAHEVYVLDQSVIDAAMATSSPNTFLAYAGNESLFFFWAFVALVVVATIAFATAFHAFEKSLGPVLVRLKPLALPVVRITAGVSLCTFGIAGKLYGTELPFFWFFGAYGSAVAEILFLALGVCIIIGFCTRLAALFAILLFAYALAIKGSYILTYADHLGAAIVLLILGGGYWSLDNAFRSKYVRFQWLHRYSHMAFPVMRMLFGFGVMFASVYAKYLHSQLALEVVYQFDLVRFFPFEPLFVVLGALIVEFLAGLLLVTGVAIRWTALFLLFWLTLSLLYFQEDVWPHIILFGLCAAIAFHGYDRYSLEGWLLKRRTVEPIM